MLPMFSFLALDADYPRGNPFLFAEAWWMRRKMKGDRRKKHCSEIYAFLGVFLIDGGDVGFWICFVKIEASERSEDKVNIQIN